MDTRVYVPVGSDVSVVYSSKGPAVKVLTDTQAESLNEGLRDSMPDNGRR